MRSQILAVSILAAALGYAALSREADPLDGHSFASEQKLEVGRGIKGPVMGHWTVRFQKGQFNWRYSDVGEIGSYTVKNGAVTANAGSGRKLQGRYDSKRRVLVWDGKRYLPQKKAAP